jgi:CrcB protein
MEKLLMIAVGGGMGSVLRFLLAGWVQGPRTPTSITFPLGTLIVNAVGSLAIGALAAMFITGPHAIREEYRVAIFIGLLGGFTTFSAFSLETVWLLEQNRFGRAAVNVLVMNIVCLGAAWAAFRLAHKLIAE